MDGELAYRLAVQLVFVVGARLGRHTEGLEWAVHARAELTRSGTSARLEFQLLGALGNLHELRGDYDQALAEHRRVLTLQEQVLPPDHPDLAHSINNTGLVEARRGELGPAITDLERALEHYERSFGPQHPELADTLNNLGIVYQQAGRYDDSLRVHQRALAIRERTFGPDHPEVAVSLNNLGTLPLQLAGSGLLCRQGPVLRSPLLLRQRWRLREPIRVRRVQRDSRAGTHGDQRQRLHVLRYGQRARVLVPAAVKGGAGRLPLCQGSCSLAA